MTNLFNPTTVQALRDRIQGEVLLPSDPGYEEARAVWNKRFDPHPGAVVRCRSTDDVVAAIGFARDHGLPLSVKSGGHSYAGHGVADGALAIDLSLMDSVEIGAERKRAVVGPGVTWAEFDGAAQQFGLATTGGTASIVGVAGYTLGGGTGYLARMFGLSLDNLLSVEVVNAGGRVFRANQDENPDLFWALRGGSGNFGVVTSFEFRLHAVGPEVVSAQAFHPLEDAREVLRFYRDFMETAPDEVTVYALAMRVPPVEPFPEEQHGEVSLVMLASHCGDPQEGEGVLAELTGFGKPILAGVQRVPYTVLQQGFDAGLAPGPRWYSRAHMLSEISDGAIETFLEYAAALPGQFTVAYFEPLGGAIGRVDRDATAFPHRDAAYELHIFPGWTDPSHDEALMRWAREFHNAMAPYATGGVYVNLLDRDEEPRIPNAYRANYDRLSQLKAKWDPENLFRINHNIRPQP